MNIDDPKFTAHVLGEVEDLSPEERAEIEALLADDSAAAAEAAEMRAFASHLRAELGSEETVVLHEEQRVAVFNAIQAAPSAKKVARFPRRATFLAALAASILVSVSAAFIYWGMQREKAATKTALAMAAARSQTNEVGAISAMISEDRPSAPGPFATPPFLSSIPTTTPAPVALGSNGPLIASTGASGTEAGQLSTPTFSVTAAVPVMSANGNQQSGERLNIIGNTRSNDKVIRREVSSSASDVFETVETLAPPTATPATASGNTNIYQNKAGISFDPAPRLTILNGQPELTPRLPARGLGQSMLELSAGNPVESPTATGAPVQSPSFPAQKMRIASVIPAPVPNGSIGGPVRLIPKIPQGEKNGAPVGAARGMVKNTDIDTGIGGFPNGADGFRIFREWYQGAAPFPSDAAVYGEVVENEFEAVRDNPLSTFSIDVDTAGYSIVRRFLNDGQRPPPDAVRIEELLNYFTYNYPQPKGDAPFSTTMEVADCPWQPEHRLVRIGLKGREMPRDHRPASNLVFLIDVSGSMDMPNKLPLLKQCFGLLIDQLGPQDQVSIVTYAGESGCALEPTHDKQKMRDAMRGLEAGGGTNGGSGLQTAYALAEKSFIKGGTNRVILATDGDWNVGVTNQNDLLAMIAAKAKTGVFLTALGFGVDNLKDTMLVQLADHGNGHYAYIDTLLEAKKVFVEQLTDTLVTIAKDVKIQVEFNPAQVAAYRLIGYEKRALAKEDFNNDRKDAGEIGAGHTVTALYEVVPAGKEPPAPRVDPLKYQSQPPPVEAVTPPKPPVGEPSKEMLTLKLRYKAPDGDTSKLLAFPLTDEGGSWAKSSSDFHFAAAVAGYGMLLRESPNKGTTNWNSVSEWARQGLGEDRSGYRAEFLSLVEKARDLGR